MSTPCAGQAAEAIGGSNFHLGNSAGNKSFNSYRLGVGVPGYTGFIPMTENIEIPHKAGCAARAPVARGDAPHGDGGTIKQQDCSHRIDFSLTPAQFAQGVAPNPLWDLHAQRPIGDPPFVRRTVDDIDRKFCGNSTFNGAYNQGFQDKQQDYPTNVLLTGQIRPPGSRVIVPTEVGAKRDPFYNSETGQKQEEGNLLMAIKKVLPPGPAPRERANRQISGVALKNAELTTTYRLAFGKFGSDPKSMYPATPVETNFKAGTSEFFQGTTKASYHPPGYSGFIPETGRNLHATAQGLCPKPRLGTKNFELQTLFQYPHHLPGYGGYRPQTAINDVGQNRDESLTTSGRDNILGTNGFVPGDLGLSLQTLAKTAPSHSAFGKTGSMVKEAFSHESLTGMLSENGHHEAEMYYRTVRPMEGRSVAIIHQGHWNQNY